MSTKKLTYIYLYMYSDRDMITSLCKYVISKCRAARFDVFLYVTFATLLLIINKCVQRFANACRDLSVYHNIYATIVHTTKGH